jgi:hypothetical protein
MDGKDYRDLFLQVIQKRDVQKIALPGGEVWVKEPSANVMLEYRQKTNQYKKDGVTDIPENEALALSSGLIADMACDPEGNLILKPEDVEALGQASMQTWRELFAACLKVAKVKTDEEEIKTPKKARPRHSSKGLPANSD